MSTLALALGSLTEEILSALEDSEESVESSVKDEHMLEVTTTRRAIGRCPMNLWTRGSMSADSTGSVVCSRRIRWDHKKTQILQQHLGLRDVKHVRKRVLALYVQLQLVGEDVLADFEQDEAVEDGVSRWVEVSRVKMGAVMVQGIWHGALVVEVAGTPTEKRSLEYGKRIITWYIRHLQFCTEDRCKASEAARGS
ncbi:hypothetical protein BDZ97DRAFT_1768202 [Flammula alnicola]|nr:hypothetical protein BDZ97DRAFT_1768202 [Flammula alnicola]